MLASEYVQAFGRDEVIFEEGTVGRHLYVVLAGSVRITRRRDGQVVTIATLGPGEFFGEMAVIEEAPRFATAIAADEATQVAPIDQAHFIYLVSHQPVFALMVLEVLSQRLRDTTERQFETALATAAAIP